MHWIPGSGDCYKERIPELLIVKNLQIQFKTGSSLVKALDGVSYLIGEKEIVGVGGESCCGV